MTTMTETVRRFACFGGRCAVAVAGEGAEHAAAEAEAELLAWHRRFTRFAHDSELAQLNADPRGTVPVTPLMACFVQAAKDAAHASGGLVDATMIGALEDAGYRRDLRGSVPLKLALGLAPARRPATGASRSRWSHVHVDAFANTVTRPPGLRFDSGGIAKGLFADTVAARLAGFAAFAVDCAGDLRVGGTARRIEVASPFDGGVLHDYELADGAIATSGIGRRSWLDDHARPAHHLLDPSTGRPAYTGVVQATALAPTALEAELRAKCAVLSGPDGAPDWLSDGGLVVFDDGSHRIVR